MTTIDSDLKKGNEKNISSIMLKGYWRLFIQLIRVLITVLISAIIVCNMMVRLSFNAEKVFPIKLEKSIAYCYNTEDGSGRIDFRAATVVEPNTSVSGSNVSQNEKKCIIKPDEFDSVQERLQLTEKLGSSYHKKVGNNKHSIGHSFFYLAFWCFYYVRHLFHNIHSIFGKIDDKGKPGLPSIIFFICLTMLFVMIIQNQSISTQKTLKKLLPNKKISNYSIEGVFLNFLCDMVSIFLFFIPLLFVFGFLGSFLGLSVKIWDAGNVSGAVWFAGFFGIIITALTIIAELSKSDSIFDYLIDMAPTNKKKKKKAKDDVKSAKKKKVKTPYLDFKSGNVWTIISSILKVLTLVLMIIPFSAAMIMSLHLSHALTLKPILDGKLRTLCYCKLRDLSSPLILVILIFSIIAILNILGKNAAVFSVLFILLFSLYNYFFGKKNKDNLGDLFKSNMEETCKELNNIYKKNSESEINADKARNQRNQQESTNINDKLTKANELQKSELQNNQ